MTKAPVADQRRLLDVQALDTRAAKLNHARRTLPVHETIAELEARIADLGRAQVETRTALSDARREQGRAEADVEQVRQRVTRHQSRLDSGAVSAKDAQAIQAELAQLARRQGVLEDAELEIMQRVEDLEERLGEFGEQERAISADVQRHAAVRDEEVARIDAELADIAARREELVGALDSGLMALYDRIRERTGGLAAVALHGSRTEGVQLDFSLSELEEIHAASAEEIVVAEGYGYILVRMGDAE